MFLARDLDQSPKVFSFESPDPSLPLGYRGLRFTAVQHDGSHYNLYSLNLLRDLKNKTTISASIYEIEISMEKSKVMMKHHQAKKSGDPYKECTTCSKQSFRYEDGSCPKYLRIKAARAEMARPNKNMESLI